MFHTCSLLILTVKAAVAASQDYVFLCTFLATLVSRYLRQKSAHGNIFQKLGGAPSLESGIESSSRVLVQDKLE